MASASGGVDWAAVIKPILAASYGSYNKSEVLELIKAINKRYGIYSLFISRKFSMKDLKNFTCSDLNFYYSVNLRFTI